MCHIISPCPQNESSCEAHIMEFPWKQENAVKLDCGWVPYEPQFLAWKPHKPFMEWIVAEQYGQGLVTLLSSAAGEVW